MSGILAQLPAGLICRLLFAAIFVFVCSPCLGGTPYPPSPVITGIQWDSTGNIIRKANGSDNWPCTWTDDDKIYTAGGDGGGFGGSRASLWVCRVSGSPASISGENIVSLATGDGASGKKGSGMLMVGGVLHMWVRNADGNGKKSQLAWSGDHGQSWSWAGWMWDEFGYCTFVNFGKNYSGARDGYVYTVSHDNPSAYNASGHMILMRVPKGSIAVKTAYEFFKQLDGNGDAVWTSDIAQRGAVFTHATAHCCRSGMSYNAALGRYLWWQQLYDGGVDTRFSGGFGVYDAPEPWGPWTTVYYTASWDVGPGDTGNFPTKWMSADGKTVHLVFSGDDAFSVRRATLRATTAPTRDDIDAKIRARRAGTAFDSDVKTLIKGYRQQ